MSETCSKITSRLIVPDGEPCDNIVDDPSWVVSRQPSEYRGLVDEIVCGGCWSCLDASLRETTNSVPCVVRADIIDRGIDHLHVAQTWKAIM